MLKLLKAMEAPITPQIATCLLTTIMTDTGGFIHSNTSADVLRLSAELMELGADKEEITERDLRQQALGGNRVLGDALSKAQVSTTTGATAGRSSTTRCWPRTGADGEDTEEIMQHLRSVEGVEVAALFKAYDGEVRVSLRSNGKLNVQAAAARLGGGGHFRASGLTFEGPFASCVRRGARRASSRRL